MASNIATADAPTSAATTTARASSVGALEVQPYLFFNGQCEAAIEFYRRTLGAKLTQLMRFKESPDPAMRPPGSGDNVMHASFQIGTTTLFASDGCSEQRPNFQGFSLSITATGTAEAERIFAALADGGQVQQPLAQTFFAARFGMVTDRFGVGWMIMAPL
jgi:PhnB protein